MADHFNLNDVNNPQSVVKAQMANSKNPRGALSTSSSKETQPSLSLTTYSLSDAMQGIALYKPAGANYGVFNEHLSKELEGLGIEPQFNLQDDKLNPYDVFMSKADSSRAGSLQYKGDDAAPGANSTSSEAIVASTAPLPGGDVPGKVWAYLREKGFTAFQVAGMMGNIQQESGFRPDIVNPIGAYGLCQWYRGRRVNLEAKAREAGVAPSDLRLQLDFLWYELNGPYNAAVLQPMKAAPDIRTATYIWLRHYEIPGDYENEMVKRLPYAQAFYEKYNK